MQLASTAHTIDRPAATSTPITHYIYDDEGHLIRTVEDDEWFQATYEVDDAGRLVREVHGPCDPGDPNPPTIYDYVYDDGGRLVLRRQWYEGPERSSEFRYDAQGRVTEETVTIHELQESIQVAYSYDSDGRLTERRELRGNGTTTAFRYDQDGYLILTREYDRWGDTFTAYEYVIETNGEAHTLHQDFRQALALKAKLERG